MSKNYEVYFTNPDSPMFLEQWLENLLQDNRELVTFSEGYWIFRIVEPLSTMECTTDNAIKSYGDFFRRNKKIAEQADTIRKLKEDAERLIVYAVMFAHGNEDYRCTMCGNLVDKGEEHKSDCPITLHRALMKELAEC